jgi:ubiquitin
MKLEIQYTRKAFKAIEKRLITKDDCNDLIIKAVKKIVKNENINIDL